MGNGIASKLNCDCDEGCRVQKVRELRLGELHPTTPGPPYLGSSSNSSPYHLTTVTASKTIDDGFEMIGAASAGLLDESIDYVGNRGAHAECQTPVQKFNDATPELVASPNNDSYDESHEDENGDQCCNTLPSFEDDKPVHLRIAEQNFSLTENVTFDPYLSCGQFIINQCDDSVGKVKSYGDGLFMKVAYHFMTLEDRNGQVYAACRSRYTFIPSYVIYAPKPRFFGQTRSSHSFSRSDQTPGLDLVKLYPWVLVKKQGRKLESAVTIHMIDDEARDGSFKSDAVFHCCHQFTGGVQTHTVISRFNQDTTSSATGVGYPCGLSIREPFNQIDLEVSDVTISPGIDPLLVICYLAIHSKMDIEPRLCPE